MKAVYAMLGATLIASFYPLAATLGIENFDPFAFVFLASFISFLTSLSFVFAWTGKAKLTKEVISSINIIREEHFHLILITSLSTTMCHIFFVYSLNFMSKAGAAIIFESWPVFTMFLAPLLIPKRWQKIKYQHISLSLICFFGVTLIGVSDQKEYLQLTDANKLVDAFDFNALLGIMLALMGSFTASISAIFRGRLSQIWEEKLQSPMLRVSLSECLTRLIGLPIAIACYLFLGEDTSFTLTVIIALLFIGIATYTGVNILYTYALMEAESSSINIMWYIMPVLSVLWLYTFGLSTLTLLILLGMALIILSNIALFFIKPDVIDKTSPKYIQAEN